MTISCLLYLIFAIGMNISTSFALAKHKGKGIELQGKDRVWYFSPATRYCFYNIFIFCKNAKGNFKRIYTKLEVEIYYIDWRERQYPKIALFVSFLFYAIHYFAP